MSPFAGGISGPDQPLRVTLFFRIRLILRVFLDITRFPLRIRVVVVPLPFLIWISLNVVEGSPYGLITVCSLVALRINIILFMYTVIIMEPHLATNDKQLFYKYLDKATNYFEFGSGGSTYQAALRANIASIHSVESDFAWYTRMVSLLREKPHVRLVYNEMDTKANTWGNPGPASTKEQKMRYSEQIRMLDTSGLDLILIDGRFRVVCCLKCFDVISDDCLIAFDDFLDRPAYHVVLAYYDIIERTGDNRMVILKKKAGMVVPNELILKYELVSG